MTEYQLEVRASTVDAMRDVLDVGGELAEGVVVDMGEGTLTISDVSKSSGFDVTTIVLTGVVTMALSVTQEMLIEWLKAKFMKKNESGASRSDVPVINIVINGQRVEVD